MQFNRVNNKEHKFSLCGQQCVDLCMCQVSTNSWSTRCSSSFAWSAFSSHLSLKHRNSTQRLFSLPSLSTVSSDEYEWGGGGAHDRVACMWAVSIYELATNGGSSWMPRAPNLHFTKKLLTSWIRLLNNVIQWLVSQLLLINCKLWHTAVLKGN